MVATIKENYAVLTELEDPAKLNVILQRIGQRLDEHDDTLETVVATSALGWQWIKNKTASSQPTLDFVLPAGHKEFWITYYNVKPENNDVGWHAKLSTDGGSTFIDGTDYRSAAEGSDSLVATAQEGLNGGANWRLVEQASVNLGVGNDTDEGVAGSIFIKDPLNPLTRTRFIGQTEYVAAANTDWNFSNGGAHQVLEKHDAIRFLFQTGDIVSGDFSLFGLKIAA